jgi:nucleoside-diphosphate-sugar epimerase
VLLTESRVDTGPADLMYGREKMIGALLCERAPFDARVGYINSAYGPGLAIHGERMKFPAAIVRKVLASRKTGDPVSVWGDGSQRRSYIYVDDVVQKIITIMDEVYAGPVNITTTPSVSCDEVTRLALKLCDVDVPIVYEDGPTGVMHREVSNAKWEDTYGPARTGRPAVPVPPFEERFAEFVDWMQEVTADESAA